MSQIPYRANLSAAEFPLTLAKAGRSVIIPGQDNNFDRRVDPQGEQKDAGIPQIIYGENIFPTPNGFQSVGYINFATIPLSGRTIGRIMKIYAKDFASVDPLGAYVIVIFTDGTAVSKSEAENVWRAVTFSGSAVAGVNRENEATFALVRGVGYLHLRNLGSSELYEVTYVGTVLTFTNVTAAVLPAGFMNGVIYITGSYNYLLAAKGSTVYWSSTTTPTDFQASLVSGSGQETPVGGKSINKLIAHSEGYNVYTIDNVVEARYTGDFRYPWRFRPITGAEKVSADDDRVFGKDTIDVQTAIESTGLVKLIQLNVNGGAVPIASQVSEYLEHDHTLDTFNYSTNAFSVAAQVDRTKSKIFVFKSRYICISASPSSISPHVIFTEIIVFDTSLQRWGKLKVAHTHLVDILAADFATQVLGVIDASTGDCKYVYFDINQTVTLPAGFTYNSMQGVFVLGRLQYARSRFLCLDELDIESTQPSAIVAVGSRNFSVFVLPSIDGKNFLSSVTPTADSAKSTGTLASYRAHTEGRNLCIGVKGAFDLVSIEAKFHVGGKW